MSAKFSVSASPGATLTVLCSLLTSFQPTPLMMPTPSVRNGRLPGRLLNWDNRPSGNGPVVREGKAAK
jgi:hypothetical protein